MPRYEPFDWYETPVYYDIIFDADTMKEADFLEAALSRYARGGARGSRRATVLEPACGSGRLVAEMARRGYGVTGFDLSAGMLAFARRRLEEEQLKATLCEARMEAFDRAGLRRSPAGEGRGLGGGFDLAHCLVSTFKYLLTESDARAHLRCVAEALRPGGVYVLGLHLSEYGQTARTRERWVATRGGVEVTCNIQGWPPDADTRTEQVRSRLIVKRSGETKHYETSWTFRTYDLPQLRRLLRSVPELEHVATFDFNYDIDSPTELDGRLLDNVLILRRR